MRDRLLRLYPRAWRDRYGDEFLATLEDRPLRASEVVDIVVGAIDARLSADVWRATLASRNTAHERVPMSLKSLAVCAQRPGQITVRDSMMGASVMVLGTLVLMTFGLAARRNGWPTTGDVAIDLSFTGALMLSMPFWLMKRSPLKTQVLMVAGTLLFMLAIGILSRAI